MSRQEADNLRRENRLVAGMLVDLGNRLQMNSVSLQRRSGAKSFLGRSRDAVNQATAVRTR